MNNEKQIVKDEILKPAAERTFITQREAMAEYPACRQTFWRLRKSGLTTYRLGAKVIFNRHELELAMRRGVAA